MSVADEIAAWKLGLAETETIDDIRAVEAQAAAAYWSAWSSLPIKFPKQELRRVPEHWLRFGTRRSLLTGSSRLATNPPNAMLNYCYALLEAESRLACAALGLDPAMGFLHLDAPRDSLALDLMEVGRANVDEFVLSWIKRGPLGRKMFFEDTNGNCRLTNALAAELAKTAAMWARAVAPAAEWIAKTLWAGRQRPSASELPTRLTQRRKREAKGNPQPTIFAQEMLTGVTLRLRLVP